MSPTPEIPNATRETVKVGTTGTVSSLMSQELESVKDSPRPAAAASTSRKKLQTAPVSVPCGYSPKKSQLRRNTPLDPGSSSSSSSSSSNSGSRSPLETQKPKPRRNGHRSPMLSPATEKNTTREDAQKKKGHTHIVEVVDLKCNNPMSSRLKKLGFSKLSESVG